MPSTESCNKFDLTSFTPDVLLEVKPVVDATQRATNTIPETSKEPNP